MKTYEVYKITNKLNNKIYIGITSQGAGVRYYKHLSDALHGSPFLYITHSENTEKKTSH